MKSIVKKLGIFALTFSLLATSVDAAPSLQEQKNDAQKELDTLEAQLSSAMSEIYTLDEQILSLGSQISQANADLEEAEEKEAAQSEAMKYRIIAMYENGNNSIWSIIFESGSIADMLKAAEHAQTMHEYDRKALEEYASTKEKITNLKASLESEQKQVQAAYEKQEEQMQKIQEMVSEQKTEVASIQEQIRKAEEKAAREAEERKAAEEAARLETEKNNTNQSSSSGGSSGNNSYVGSGDASKGQQIVNAAMKYLNVPYVYGGSSMSGIDCSGLTMRAHEAVGISIPRTSGAQRKGGKDVGGVDIGNALPGDVLCYDGHVALYIGNGKVIHAPEPGRVVEIRSWKMGPNQPLLAIRRYW